MLTRLVREAAQEGRMADNPTCEICERVAEVQALLDETSAKSYRLRGFGRSLTSGEIQFAGVVSRHSPISDWVLFPFPPRAVHADGGLDGEACSRIEHPLSSRQGIPYRSKRRTYRGRQIPQAATIELRRGTGTLCPDLVLFLS